MNKKMINKIYTELRKYNSDEHFTKARKNGSLALKIGSIVGCIENYFQIVDKNDKELFEKKYIEATSGDGSEGIGGQRAKILELHSSALLQLLFFYNVNIQPIKININNKEVTFDEAYFEYKNTCVAFKRPSNIDVVLLSKTDKAILFLESKFTEYLIVSHRSAPISKKYKTNYYSKNIYDKFETSKDKSFCVNNSLDGCFCLESSEKRYLNGIKQLISHYVGICNFIKGNSIEKNIGKEKVYEFYKDEKPTIYFGTVLYKFNSSELNSFFDSYKECYKELIDVFKDSCNEIVFLNDILTYQDLNKEHLKKEIREFYFN